MHVTWCFSLLSPPLFKGGIVIASARLSVCLSVHLSVCYALSSLTIGRNPTKFGVRDFHLCGVCDSTFFCHPTGAPGKVQRSTIIFEKSISKIFIPNFMIVLKNKRNGIFILSPGSYSSGWDLGLLGGQNFYFFPNMVVWHIKLKGMVSRTGHKLNVHPVVKLVTLRYSQ